MEWKVTDVRDAPNGKYIDVKYGEVTLLYYIVVENGETLLRRPRDAQLSKELDKAILNEVKRVYAIGAHWKSK